MPRSPLCVLLACLCKLLQTYNKGHFGSLSPLRPTYLCDADLEIWRSETVTRCPLNSRESGWAMCMQYVGHDVNSRQYIGSRQYICRQYI